MATENKQNIMGYEPIGKLIMKLSLPLMLSMLIQALYNVVDSIFVSRVSELALTAVSLAFPLQNLMIAFSIVSVEGLAIVVVAFWYSEYDLLLIPESSLQSSHGRYSLSSAYSAPSRSCPCIQMIHCCLRCLQSTYGSVLYSHSVSSSI